MDLKKLLSIIVPIMNEQGNIRQLYSRICNVLEKKIDFELIFVDDGSTDNTLNEIKELVKNDKRVKFISFSRNFGHQNALKAGLDFASGDAAVSLDGDLQHPPELIPKMIKKWQEGYDIVYTIREDNGNTSFFKKKTSALFYKIINYLSDVTLDEGSADFRLINRKVLEVLKQIKETPVFYRGITKWIGFKQFAIPYEPEKRLWGETKYSVKKMFNFAVFGITSFSVKPLRISILFGMFFTILAFLYSLYALYEKLFTNNTIEGWTSILIMISFIGGVQLVLIGVMGEYIGKLFMESKNRPTYIINEKNL